MGNETKHTPGRKRERAADGRYDLTNLEQRCVCGRKAGEHLAKRPHDLEEACCPGFRAERHVDRQRRMAAKASGPRAVQYDAAIAKAEGRS